MKYFTFRRFLPSILKIPLWGNRKKWGLIPDKNDTSEIELLHGQWDELNQLLSDCGAAMIGQWKEHVHGSLSRLILLASIAPLN